MTDQEADAVKTMIEEFYVTSREAVLRCRRMNTVCKTHRFTTVYHGESMAWYVVADPREQDTSPSNDNEKT